MQPTDAIGPGDSGTIVRSTEARYPWELVRTVALPDGTRLCLRPIRRDDEPRLVALFGRLSLRTVYQRFFTPLQRLPAAWYRRFADVDYVTRLALVAEDAGEGDAALRAVGRYEPNPAGGGAEVAIVVEDAWQGRGLGTRLLDALLRAAEARGIRRFSADLLAENHRMLHVLTGLAEIRRRELSSGVLTLQFERRPATRELVA